MQEWSSENYAKNAAFVAVLGEDLIDILSPKESDTILDLGCGDGALTSKIAKKCKKVVGIDSAPDFINTCKEKGLEAYCVDAVQMEFKGEFDGILSNAVLHWIMEPEKVIQKINTALKPNGKFVAEFGGDGNVANIMNAIENVAPKYGFDAQKLKYWYFPTAKEYGALLEKNGFEVVSIVTFDRPTKLPTDIVGWLNTFAKTYIAAVAPDLRAAFLEDVRLILESKLLNDKNEWVADYVRLRVEATKIKEIA
jgi:trans-aconitate methyltransferase